MGGKINTASSSSKSTPALSIKPLLADMKESSCPLPADTPIADVVSTEGSDWPEDEDSPSLICTNVEGNFQMISVQKRLQGHLWAHMNEGRHWQSRRTHPRRPFQGDIGPDETLPFSWALNLVSFESWLPISPWKAKIQQNRHMLPRHNDTCR